MAKKDSINELCEIIATSLAARPELKDRVSTLLGGRIKPVLSKKEEETKEARKQRIRQQFNRQFIKQQLNKSA